jgi:uncharacterized protein YbcV (DUF1398 family)
MKNSEEKLEIAMKFAMMHRPTVGGFPFLAECLRQAGVIRNLWSLPAAQSIYVLNDVTLVKQGSPIDMAKIPAFNEQVLINALRIDQAGKSSFLEFLEAACKAGVISYEVDFLARTVSYFGAHNECYKESYPLVDAPLTFS